MVKYQSVNYYTKKQVLAAVDKNGEILGKTEKWQAHKNGVLHKAFSVVLIYKNLYLMQFRKHPVFDRVFDVSSSSHQVYKNNKLENINDAVSKTLKREWGLEVNDFSGKLKSKGFVIYKSKDENSVNLEHEYCELLEIKIKKLPRLNLNYAYGYVLLSKEEIYNKKRFLNKLIAPWVKEMIKQKLI